MHAAMMPVPIIMMSATMKMCFEPDNLLNASPATVSRAGIIFVSDTILDWYPPVQTWLDGRREDEREILDGFFQKYGQSALDKVVIKFRREGAEVELLGMNEASATIVDRFGVHDKPEEVEKILAGH